MLYLAFVALQLVTYLRCSLAAGACPTPTGVPDWIDSSTPADACSKNICTGSFTQCSSRTAAKENMVLVFSDEFNRPGRDFVGQTGDRIWTAMDMYYSSDFAEEQNYKPDKVRIAQGALQLTMAEEQSFATLNSAAGPKTGVLMNKTSGMVQSWNKFCFTGGFVEFSIKLPGNAKDSGFWAAAWLEGNLGRAGYLRSTAGRWPYSYDLCDGSGKLPWSDSAGQRTTRCGNAKGRGAPEIDVLEYGIFSPPDYSGDTSPTPLYIHTMQMGPIAPPNTTYMKGFRTCEIPGIACPGARDKTRGTYFTQPYSPLSSEEFPRAGSTLTDTYSASSRLGPEHFERYHTYSVLWEPGEYVRWYLDDEFLFEVNKEALRGQTNSLDQSIGDRLIPHEAMYIILNLAMSDKSWSKVSPDLKFPATMSVDYVRVYQRQSAVNIGCDPPDYPTQDIIACNKEEYLSPDEMELWRLGVCSSIGSKDNQILLGFSIAAALVAIGAGALWLVWLRARVADKQLDDKQTLEDLQAVSGVGKEAGCYVTSWALANPTQALGATRPDLLAVGRHAQAQQSAASDNATSLKTLKST